MSFYQSPIHPTRGNSQQNSQTNITLVKINQDNVISQTPVPVKKVIMQKQSIVSQESWNRGETNIKVGRLETATPVGL